MKKAVKLRHALSPAWIAAGLGLAVLAIYWQTTAYRFIDFDDDAYILNNPPVRGGLTGTGIAWAFTSVRYFYWQPLTWLSHMLDCQIYGLNPGGHHFTNVLLHAANAVLLFLLLLRLTGRLYRSGFAAALFALHPLRVESVAWIAERKDVLSAFFWLLCLLLYARYVAQRTPGRYLAVVAAFCAGLMSKPMTVTLPVVLLLMDYWPLRRTDPLLARIKEKLPLFALSAISSAITVEGQQEMGAMASLEKLPVATRILNAIIGYGQYLGKTFWPRHLAILYPLRTNLAIGTALAVLVLLIAISLLAFAARRRQPWLVVGWCWFLVVLLPTIGLVQSGGQAFADRFTYLPHIGLVVALVWGAAELLAPWPQGRTVAVALAATILPALAVASWVQTGYWEDSVSVARHAIAVTGDNAVMEHDLAYALALEGRRGEAIAHYARSLTLAPDNYAGQYDLGKALVEDGRPDEAAAHFRASVRLKPDYAEAHFALATVLARQNDSAGAAREFELALAGSLSDEYAATAHNDLGVILGQRGRFAEAATHFAAAARLKPDLIAAHVNYARALAAQNKSEEARAWLTEVLRRNGENAELRAMLNSLAK